MNDTITAVELQSRLAKNDPIVLIDVRRKSDVTADPALIPGAVWRDPESVSSWAGTVSPEQEVVIYCVRGGSVSKATLETLRTAGLNATYVEGGLAAWKDNGGGLAPRE